MSEDRSAPPSAVSAERIIAAADALRRFSNHYLDLLEDDISADERRRLHEAAELLEQALERFE